MTKEQIKEKGKGFANNEKIVAGVCHRIAQKIGVNALWVRLTFLFVGLFVSYFTAIFTYVVALLLLNSKETSKDAVEPTENPEEI